MDFKHELQTYLAVHPHRGCDDDDLALVQSRSPFPLPADYLQFLRSMGRGADGFLVGSDYAFPKLLEVQDWTKEMIQESPPTLILPPWFSIAMHQGYQFYALTDSGVWYYREGAASAAIRFSDFSAWFRAMKTA